jgi:hypothetical protein
MLFFSPPAGAGGFHYPRKNKKASVKNKHWQKLERKGIY